MPSSYVAPLIEPPKHETVPFISVVNFTLRHGVKMLAGGLILSLLYTIPSRFAKPTYTATTTFITEGEQPAGRLVLGGLTLPSTAGRTPEFFVELMRSPAVLGPLVEMRIPAEQGRAPQTLIERYVGGQTNQQIAREEAIRVVAAKIGTKISINGVITLRVTAEDPRLAAGIAGEVLTQLDEFNNNKRKTQASAERKFAEQRLAETTADLRVAEERLKNFHERNRDISKSPALALEGDRIADDVSTKRALRGSVLQAYETAKMDEVRDSPRATVLAPPLAPPSPDARTAKRYVVLGFFVGAMLVGLACLATDYFARIHEQPTREADEFEALRTAWVARVRKPVMAVTSAVRKPRDSARLQ